jgi:hypothetical protein
MCAPGSVIDLGTYDLSGGDLRGTVHIQGQARLLGGEDLTTATAGLEFTGSVFAPPFTDSGTAQLSAPFTMTGWLDVPLSVQPFFNVLEVRLSGSGTATLTLRKNVQIGLGG